MKTGNILVLKLGKSPSSETHYIAIDSIYHVKTYTRTLNKEAIVTIKYAEIYFHDKKIILTNEAPSAAAYDTLMESLGWLTDVEEI